MKKLFFPVLFLFVAFGNPVFSQQTGSFNTSILFNGEARTLACYAPADYTSPNLVISLHGAGDNAANLRDVLINQAQWQTIFTNTVLVFIDGGDDRARDFYSPEGDEAIIDSAIAWASKEYNTNADSIVIHGFSLGGRSALKWGLDNPEKIRGLVLHTPAVQSPKDVQNILGASLLFNYANASKLNIAMSVGNDDIGFIKTVTMLSDSLAANNAKLFFIPYPDLAHSITPNQVSQLMFQYAKTTLKDPRPMIHKFYFEPYYNTNLITPKAMVRNFGPGSITNFTISYQLNNGEVKTFDWTGNLESGYFTEVELPEIEAVSSANALTAHISYFNETEFPPTQIFNDYSGYFNVFTPAKSIPYTETFADFDAVTANWALKESGNYLSWMPASNMFGQSLDAIGMLNTILAYDNFGLTESLVSNVFDFKPNGEAAKEPKLDFDVAYNYTHYTAELMGVDTDLMDTLEVLISNDNGATFTSIFKKYGEDLRTFTNVFENIQDIMNYGVLPTENEWKTISIDLTEYQPSDKTQFKFNCISGSGSITYLRNVKFYDANASSVEDSQVGLEIYPNPVSDYLIVKNSESETNNQITIYNSLGTVVYTGEISGRINVSNLSSGIYTIQIGSFTKTIIKL